MFGEIGGDGIGAGRAPPPGALRPPPGTTVSFARAPPYSADFYLANRIRRDHSGELEVYREGRHWAYR